MRLSSDTFDDFKEYFSLEEADKYLKENYSNKFYAKRIIELINNKEMTYRWLANKIVIEKEELEEWIFNNQLPF